MRELIKAGVAVLLVCLSLAAPVAADSLDTWDGRDGWVAYDRGDYATAVRLWRPLAVHGDAVAQSLLAHMYASGRGVPKDYVEAVNWYRKAAEQGLTSAQVALGVIYEKGQGVPQDYVEAVKWYREAAEQGDAEAQFKLGDMYDNGDGVPQDNVQAHKWFNLAAAHFPATDTKNSSKAVSNRERLANSMTPAQIAKAQKLAREWKPK